MTLVLLFKVGGVSTLECGWSPFNGWLVTLPGNLHVRLSFFVVNYTSAVANVKGGRNSAHTGSKLKRRLGSKDQFLASPLALVDAQTQPLSLAQLQSCPSYCKARTPQQYSYGLGQYKRKIEY